MIRFFCFFTLVIFGACKPSPPTADVSAPSISSSRSLKVQNKKYSSSNCTISGDILSENKLLLADHSLLISISADSTTMDSTFGNSHRILSLYNTTNCQQALRLVLPINRSPDFPYYLADRNYSNNSDMIAIKGVDHFYCLDLNNKKLLPPLRPTFKSPRLTVDAQSNQIQRLEVWENFIIGYAQDQGVFVYQINSSNVPAAILPYAEYKVRDNLYHGLFLLASEEKVQAIIPSYNWEEDVFKINPVFKQPILLKKEAPSKKQNNAYTILRKADTNQAIAIDLKNRKRVALPVDIQQKPNKDIELFLRKESGKSSSSSIKTKIKTY